MNTDTGEFVGPDRAEAWMERLGIGEIVKIKGEELEVIRIEGREVTLKLRSWEDRFVDTKTIEALRELTKTPLFKGKEKRQRDKRHR